MAGQADRNFYWPIFPVLEKTSGVWVFDPAYRCGAVPDLHRVPFRRSPRGTPPANEPQDRGSLVPCQSKCCGSVKVSGRKTTIDSRLPWGCGHVLIDRLSSGRVPKTQPGTGVTNTVAIVHAKVVKGGPLAPPLLHTKMLRPLDLDNLSRREIPQYINGAWFGWHAFRRGLGTRLNEAGVNDKDIQSILRDPDVSTTQAYYILPNHERAKAGMRKLDKTLRTKYGIKG